MRAEAQIVLNGHFRKDLSTLWHEHQPARSNAIRGEAINSLTKEDNLACRAAYQTAERTQ
jgi:hypothetical protein